jgi:choline dehydrogenase
LHKAGGIEPGSDKTSDADLLARARGSSIFHPSGTCMMGPATNPTAVVDAELRVHGLSGLRVADASVMPTVVSGNTNAACIMIGEKCADLLLAAR